MGQIGCAVALIAMLFLVGQCLNCDRKQVVKRSENVIATSINHSRSMAAEPFFSEVVTNWHEVRVGQDVRVSLGDMTVSRLRNGRFALKVVCHGRAGLAPGIDLGVCARSFSEDILSNVVAMCGVKISEVETIFVSIKEVEDQDEYYYDVKLNVAGSRMDDYDKWRYDIENVRDTCSGKTWVQRRK